MSLLEARDGGNDFTGFSPEWRGAALGRLKAAPTFRGRLWLADGRQLEAGGRRLCISRPEGLRISRLLHVDVAATFTARFPLPG